MQVMTVLALLKYYVMLINFDAVAEEYCSTFSDDELVDIKDNGIDFEVLKEWAESEVEGFSTDEDVEDLNNAIMSYAEFIVNERKQEAASELRSSIEIILDEQCSILEDYEIASILAEYVSGYLQTGL